MHVGTASAASASRIKRLNSLSSSNLGLETRFDARNRSCGATRFTAKEMQSVGGFSLQFGVHRFACFACDVFNNVSSQHRLHLLRLELTLQHQSLFTVNGTRGTQLSKQELNQVLWVSLQNRSNVLDVGKQRLLRTFSLTHWWRNLELGAASVTSQLRVVLFQNSEKPRQEELVWQAKGSLY